MLSCQPSVFALLVTRNLFWCRWDWVQKLGCREFVVPLGELMPFICSWALSWLTKETGLLSPYWQQWKPCHIGSPHSARSIATARLLMFMFAMLQERRRPFLTLLPTLKNSLNSTRSRWDEIIVCILRCMWAKDVNYLDCVNLCVWIIKFG